jgi:hypothetical protein
VSSEAEGGRTARRRIPGQPAPAHTVKLGPIGAGPRHRGAARRASPCRRACARFVLDCSRDRRRAGRRLDARANRRGYPPRNPLPVKRIPAQIRSLCRAYTGEAVRSLAAIMRNADAPPRARIQAADIHLRWPRGSRLAAIGRRARRGCARCCSSLLSRRTRAKSLWKIADRLNAQGVSVPRGGA